MKKDLFIKEVCGPNEIEKNVIISSFEEFKSIVEPVTDSIMLFFRKEDGREIYIHTSKVKKTQISLYDTTSADIELLENWNELFSVFYSCESIEVTIKKDTPDLVNTEFDVSITIELS